MQPSTSKDAKLPLSQVLVLDLTLARAGPTCVRHLADWGANVIRVEPPVPSGEDVVGRRHGSAGIPSGPINTIDKVFADPQVKHLGIAAPVHSPLHGDTHLVGSALNFPGASKEIRTSTPEAGAHTDEVLQWIGYSTNEIEKMRAGGVI